MKPGDELLQNIEAVIRNCKVGVVIFCPNYCSSYFCLHELALMTEYQKKIIPIFYDVNPSDLVVVNDGSYPAKDLHRFRLELEQAKRRVGLPFDSSNGKGPSIVKHVLCSPTPFCE
ncbi:TIR-only protein-like [Macadamia integrifolia]|uniref:TIR-only protein-like n=1 Tax=Macadamia integrifolia TaxID=60698 RepID=UPI001C4F67F7|nr:TIR-only protein-like [Macadamia integrifolia]